MEVCVDSPFICIYADLPSLWASESPLATIWTTDCLSGFLDRMITVSYSWQRLYLAEIMGGFQLQARLKCCYKHLRNLHGAKHTIQEYALASYICPVIAVLSGRMASLDPCLYLKCRSHAGQIPVSSRLLFSTTLTHVVKQLSIHQAPSLCHLPRYIICIVMWTFRL